MIEFIDNKDGTTTITNFASDRNVKCLIDTEDVPRILEVSKNWFYHKERGYVLATPKGKTVEIHRLINKTPDGMITDHINGDKLDNRKRNLRTVTHKQNAQNAKSHVKKYKGVYELGDGRFRVVCNRLALGTFNNAEDAARAYNIKAVELFGEYACINNVQNPFKTPIKTRKTLTPNPPTFKVCYYKQFQAKPWKVYKYYNKTYTNLGYYKTKEEAEEARNKFEKQFNQD